MMLPWLPPTVLGPPPEPPGLPDVGRQLPAVPPPALPPPADDPPTGFTVTEGMWSEIIETLQTLQSQQQVLMRQNGEIHTMLQNQSPSVAPTDSWAPIADSDTNIVAIDGYTTVNRAT